MAAEKHRGLVLAGVDDAVIQGLAVDLRMRGLAFEVVGLDEGTEARLTGKDGPEWLLVGRKEAVSLLEARAALASQLKTMRAINQYAAVLADMEPSGLHAFVARSAREIFGARLGACASYDEARKDLVCTDIDWSEADSGLVRRLVGGALKDKAVRLSDGEYRAMMARKVGVSSSLSEISFGKVPPAVSTAIGAVLGLPWFRGLVLESEGRLFGGIGLAGGKGQAEPDDVALRVFAEITASLMKKKEAAREIRRLLAEQELLLREVPPSHQEQHGHDDQPPFPARTQLQVARGGGCHRGRHGQAAEHGYPL